MAKRVLHVVGGMDRAGTETLLMNAYRALDRGKVQFDFAVTADRICDYDGEIAVLGGRVLRHPPPSKAALAYRRALRRTLEKGGPFHAVHSHVQFFSGLVLRIAHQAGIPVRVAHSHTTRDGHSDSPARLGYRFVMRRLILSHATDLLCTARSAGEALYGRDCWSDPRVRIVPNGIDLAAYRSLSGRGRAIRKEAGIKPEALLVGHVGRFHPVKNHRFLIEVFAAVRRSRPNAELILAGDGELRPEVEGQVRDRGLDGWVHFVGVRADVPEVMAALDVLVFPSIYEGLGMVVVEAQAAGVPTVVSEAVPKETDASLNLIRRLPLEAGPERWADAVLQSQTVRRPQWEDRNRALCQAGYTVSRMVQTLEGVYGIC